jgi:hypothetical protein
VQGIHHLSFGNVTLLNVTLNHSQTAAEFALISDQLFDISYRFHLHETISHKHPTSYRLTKFSLINFDIVIKVY